MRTMNLLEAAAKFHAIGRDMNDLGPAIVARACEMVCAEAKRVIGVGYKDWPALAPSTLAHKSLNTPLLETGEMRASIGWHAEGLHGEVGSDSDKAVWQELGTSRIPPRPFLTGAAQHMEDQIHRMAAKAVRAVLGGRGLHSSEMGELLHLLKHAGHAVKEAVDRALEPDDKNENRR